MPDAKQKALFLDRDGVINVDRHYVHRVEDVEFVDGIFDLCRSAHAAGYLIIVITNQAGIGRGYYTTAEFYTLMRWMEARFAEEGCPLTACYFCPHHPEAGLGEYKQQCDCRKPMPGMFLAAMRDHHIDMAESIMIGDKESDLQAARAAGVTRCVLVEGVLPRTILGIE